MTAPHKTSTPTLVSALRILAGEIESPDGVANMAIGEGADRIAELEEKAERYRLTTLRQDARVAELEAEIERWRVATAKIRDGADEAARVANEQIDRAEARVKELEAERDEALRERAETNTQAMRDAKRADECAVSISELAGALRSLSLAVHAKIQVQGADGNYVLSMDVAAADRTLARHAAGELAQEACGGRCGDPLCNLSTEGELMRTPADPFPCRSDPRHNGTDYRATLGGVS